MQATTVKASESPVRQLAEQRTVLRNIRWRTFEQLLSDLGDDRSICLTYYKGLLEIMTPFGQHEGSNRFIDDLIRALADERNLNLRKFGSRTMKRMELETGAEPDSCYYIQNEPSIRSKIDIDLDRDPPPDLVVEIDITSSSIDKLVIYAILGVPELWRYDGRKLAFYVLEGSNYIATDRSPTFPRLPSEIILQFLEYRFQVGETMALREFRAWVRQQQGSEPSN